MNTKSTPRNSGLELLRIIAMLMIVAAHLSQRGNWEWGPSSSANHFLMDIIICLGQVGVAIFFSITGYFLYSSKKLSYKRILKVLRPTWFYSIFFLIFFFILSPSSFNLTWPLSSPIAHSLFPIVTNSYWFISAYVCLSLLLPYLKKWFDSLTDKELLSLLIIVGLIYIVPNIISYVFYDSSAMIFTIPSALFYCLAGYTIHRNQKILSKVKTNRLFLIHVLGLVIYIFSSILIHVAKSNLGYTNINNNILIDTMSLPCILMSLPLVILFSRWNFVNKIINYFGSLTFGVYLIHSNILVVDYVWRSHDLLHTSSASNYGFLHFLGYFLLTTLIVFFSSCLIESIRIFVTKNTLTIIRKNKHILINQENKKV